MYRNLIRIDCVTESPNSTAMMALFFLFLTLFVSPFKSKSQLEAKNAALRHQLIVLQRRVRGRVQLTNGDRLFLVLLYRCVGIGPAFAITGVGNPAPLEAGPKSTRTYAR